MYIPITSKLYSYIYTLYNLYYGLLYFILYVSIRIKLICYLVERRIFVLINTKYTYIYILILIKAIVCIVLFVNFSF